MPTPTQLSQIQQSFNPSLFGDISQWVMIIFSLLIGLVNFLQTRKSNYIAEHANTISEETQAMTIKQASESRRPYLVIHKEILDKDHFTDGLSFETGGFYNDDSSVGIKKVKLIRSKSGKTEAGYCLVLNAANNSEPKQRVDNFAYFVIVSAGPRIKRLEALGLDVQFIDRYISYKPNKHHHSIEIEPNEDVLYFYLSIRQDNDNNKLFDMSKYTQENWDLKYTKTNDGDTKDMHVYSGFDLYNKLIFYVKMTNWYEESYTDELIFLIETGEFKFPHPEPPKPVSNVLNYNLIDNTTKLSIAESNKIQFKRRSSKRTI